MWSSLISKVSFLIILLTLFINSGAIACLAAFLRDLISVFNDSVFKSKSNFNPFNLPIYCSSIITSFSFLISVTDDLIGLSGFYPKFVKKYLDLERIIEKTIKRFKEDVRKRKFPKKTNTYWFIWVQKFQKK